MLADRIVYTGTNDAYFDYRIDMLEYYSVWFQAEITDKPNFQGNAIMNYTDRESPWTQIIERKCGLSSEAIKIAMSYLRLL